jgi:hypothetical protein
LLQFWHKFEHSLQKVFEQFSHFEEQIKQGFLLQEKHLTKLVLLIHSWQKILLHNLQLLFFINPSPHLMQKFFLHLLQEIISLLQ